jgi:hypothetical protein
MPQPPPFYAPRFLGNAPSIRRTFQITVLTQLEGEAARLLTAWREQSSGFFTIESEQVPSQDKINITVVPAAGDFLSNVNNRLALLRGAKDYRANIAFAVTLIDPDAQGASGGGTGTGTGTGTANPDGTGGGSGAGTGSGTGTPPASDSNTLLIVLGLVAVTGIGLALLLNRK